MLQEYKIAYDLNRRTRYLTWAGLGSVTLFLLWVEGGFPPLAWRLFAQELQSLPVLWAAKGASVLLPLILLAALSLLWLLSWSLLLLFSLTLLWPHKPDSRHIAWRESRNLNVHEVLPLDETPYQEDTVNIPKLTLPHKAPLVRAGSPRPLPLNTPTHVGTASARPLPPSQPSPIATTAAPTRTATARPLTQPLSHEDALNRLLRASDAPEIQVRDTPNQSLRVMPLENKDMRNRPPQRTSQSEQRPVLVSIGTGSPRSLPSSPRKANPTTPLPQTPVPRTWQRQQPGALATIDDIPTTPEGSPRAGTSRAAHKATRLNVGVGWNTGITRRQRPNEDSLIVLQGMCTYNDQLVPFGLFVVADGMGGHDHGQEASHIAIQAVMQTVLHDVVASSSLNDTMIIELLVNGVEKANTAICQRCRDYGKDMGTTLTAALIVDAKAYVVNVGDSRTYLYDDANGLSQITLDHSLVANLVIAGVITPDEIYTHPERNKVYRSLGNRDGVEVDWFTRELRNGDSLLLCSDGLWEMVRDPDIARILTKGANPTITCDMLIHAALRGGGADNISAIIVHIEN